MSGAPSLGTRRLARSYVRVRRWFSRGFGLWLAKGVGGAASAVSGLATGALVVSALVALPFVELTPLPKDAISFDHLNPPSARTLVLYGDDGKVFARRGGCVASPVQLSEVSPHVTGALIAMEDRRFYYHFGIDPIGMVRAAYRNWRAGHTVEGGSTLTQQLAKNAFLTRKQTLDRKIKEAVLSLWLEVRLSKQEILERYLSRAYFGQGCFGLRAAAQRYFKTPVDKLTVAQSAYLVGLLKSPTQLSQNLPAAQARAKLVEQAMADNGVLKRSKLAALPPPEPVARPSEHFGGYYADWVADSIQVPKNGDFTPLKVRTSFDPGLQAAAQKAVDAILAKYGKQRHAGQAALVAMRTDGRVVAMVGGRDYGKSQFNRAVQARRQPGSSFKLFVYLAALRAGLTPDSQVADAPIEIGNYTPENFGHNYRGVVSLRRGLAASINTVAVRLSEAMGRQPVIEAARDLGLTSELKPTPSLALGAFEAELLQMTSAYAAVAAGAYPVKPWAVEAFGDRPATDALPPQGSGEWDLAVAGDMRSLLQGVVNGGSGHRARLPIATYGKTGTSQDFRDAWFIGFAGNLVVGVWVGNDDSSPMAGVTGGSLPAMIWHQFMSDALEHDKGFQRELPHIAAFPAKPAQHAQIALAEDTLLQGAKPEAEEETEEGLGLFARWRKRRLERRGIEMQELQAEQSGGAMPPGPPPQRRRGILGGGVLN